MALTKAMRALRRTGSARYDNGWVGVGGRVGTIPLGVVSALGDLSRQRQLTD